MLKRTPQTDGRRADLVTWSREALHHAFWSFMVM